MTGISDRSRTIINRRECSLWTIPDEASDASRTPTIVVQNPAASGRVTIPDPSDTLGDPVVEIGENLKNLRQKDKRNALEESVACI